MSSFFVDLEIALLDVVEHRRRAFLLSAAIATVSALFVVLGALSEGIRNTFDRLSVHSFHRTPQCRRIFQSYLGAGQPGTHRLPENRRRDQAHDAPSSTSSSNEVAALESDRQQGLHARGIAGIQIRSEPAFKSALDIESGDVDELAKPNTILVFADEARRLELKVGDAVTISAPTMRGVANTVDCTVIAIARDMGPLSKWTMVMPGFSAKTLSAS